MPMMKRDFDLFEDVFNVPVFRNETLMKTDVYEKDGNYVMKMDLPGYRKEDIQISLDNGNLSVSANRSNSTDEKDDQGNIIRQERFTGTASRTFYVGKQITDQDVKASFEDGILTLTVPSQKKKEIEEKKYIEIL
jgi:HSP20 family molecular chaperone IbpA